MKDTHFRWDPNHPYVHIALDDSMLKLGLCGAVTGKETQVIGARVCLACVAREMEHELKRIQDLLREHSPGGPPDLKPQSLRRRWTRRRTIG